MGKLLFLFVSSIFLSSFAGADSAKNSFVNGDKTYVANEVDKLRDALLNSKLQLRMFNEILKTEGINKFYPKLHISFRNDLTERYRIFSVEYIIDGVKTYYHQTDLASKDRAPAKTKETVSDFSTTISPGKHNIQVIVNFMGNDSGIFSYLAEYKVQVSDDNIYEFVKNTDYKLHIRTFEEGGLLTDFKDRAKLDVALSKVSR